MTFRETLAWSMFEDTFPPFLPSSEREDYWDRAGDVVPEGRRLRELGKIFRAGQWADVLQEEFDRLAGQPGSFERLKTKHAAEAKGHLWMGS
jgi:hypothetical protein